MKCKKRTIWHNTGIPITYSGVVIFYQLACCMAFFRNLEFQLKKKLRREFESIYVCYNEKHCSCTQGHHAHTKKLVIKVGVTIRFLIIPQTQISHKIVRNRILWLQHNKRSHLFHSDFAYEQWFLLWNYQNIFECYVIKKNFVGSYWKLNCGCTW